MPTSFLPFCLINCTKRHQLGQQTMPWGLSLTRLNVLLNTRARASSAMYVPSLALSLLVAFPSSSALEGFDHH
jgi:hypothetical protein